MTKQFLYILLLFSFIDASQLGFSAKKSTIAWNAALNANFNILRNLLAQLNTRYTAKSLTPLVKQRVERKRPSQIFYAGFVFHFGKTQKKQKEPVLNYDEGI